MFAASRRMFSAQAAPTAPAKAEPLAGAERVGGWFERNGVGVSLILGIGAAVVAAVRADITAGNAKEAVAALKT